jgi:hypothetical protein
MNTSGQKPWDAGFNTSPPSPGHIAATVDALHRVLQRHGFERDSAFSIRPVDDDGPYLHIVAAWIRAPLTDEGMVYSPQVGYVQAADGASVWGSGLVRIGVASGSLALMMQGLRPEWLASVAEHFLGLADSAVT